MSDDQRARLHAQLDVLLGRCAPEDEDARAAEYRTLDQNHENAVRGAMRLRLVEFVRRGK